MKDLSLSPRILRLSLFTMLNQMNIPDEVLMYLSGNKERSKSCFFYHFQSKNRIMIQIRAAQALIETLLYTVYELECKFNKKVDIENIYNSISYHYAKTLNDINYLKQFKAIIYRETLLVS